MKKLEIKADNNIVQFIKYSIVGGVAFAIDFSTLFILTNICSIHYLFSATIAFVLGLFFNYILSIKWVFKHRNYSPKTEFIIFSTIGIIGVFLNELIIWYFTEIIQFYYLYSKLISTILILFFNFFLRKNILFNSCKRL